MNGLFCIISIMLSLTCFSQNANTRLFEVKKISTKKQATSVTFKSAYSQDVKAEEIDQSLKLFTLELNQQSKKQGVTSEISYVSSNRNSATIAKYVFEEVFVTRNIHPKNICPTFTFEKQKD